MAHEHAHENCARIYNRWDACARARDVEGLLALYAPDATLESPLIPAILNDVKTGVCRGHVELRRFFAEGGRRRPNELVRWYRTGSYLCDGKMLVWEYPREAPEGSQVDIIEVMELAAGKIQRHRIYWGWFGVAMLQQSRESKVPKQL